jgi:hypothetical protein
MSARTARRALASENLHRRKAHKVVYLKKEHRRTWKQWAMKCRDYTAREWDRIIWSDESYIYIGDDKGTIWVTRSPDEEYDEACVVPTFKQSSVRIMVWGCIMKGSKGPLVILDYPRGRGGGMTAKSYQEQVLDRHLHDYYLRMLEERGMVVFQQDGAPSHHVKSTLAWLNYNGIDIFPHPPSSPDMSPIEPLWGRLKSIICSRPRLPTSVDELKVAAQEAWDQITEKEIDAHVKLMGDRVKAVLAAKGGNMRY